MPTDDWERGYAAGWRAAQRDDIRDISRDMGESRTSPKKKRKASAYSKRYGAAFRKFQRDSREKWLLEERRIQEGTESST